MFLHVYTFITCQYKDILHHTNRSLTVKCYKDVPIMICSNLLFLSIAYVLLVHVRHALLNGVCVSGEFVPHGVNVTACRHEPLVLSCPADSVVATKLYGGHHKNDNSTTCSYLPGDCQSSIRGLRITNEHWADCLWKKVNCTIKLPDKHVFLYKPCLPKTIHYLIAEDLKCVPSKYLYV